MRESHHRAGTVAHVFGHEHKGHAGEHRVAEGHVSAFFWAAGFADGVAVGGEFLAGAIAIFDPVLEDFFCVTADVHVAEDHDERAGVFDVFLLKSNVAHFGDVFGLAHDHKFPGLPIVTGRCEARAADHFSEIGV